MVIYAPLKQKQSIHTNKKLLDWIETSPNDSFRKSISDSLACRRKFFGNMDETSLQTNLRSWKTLRWDVFWTDWYPNRNTIGKICLIRKNLIKKGLHTNSPDKYEKNFTTNVNIAIEWLKMFLVFISGCNRIPVTLSKFNFAVMKFSKSAYGNFKCFHFSVVSVELCNQYLVNYIVV